MTNMTHFLILKHRGNMGKKLKVILWFLKNTENKKNGK